MKHQLYFCVYLILANAFTNSIAGQSLQFDPNGYVGGEITYNFFGNNDYLIELTLYKDCNDASTFDDPAFVSVFNDAGELVDNLELPVALYDTLTNDPCPLLGNSCITFAYYYTTILLPQQGGYYFVYQRCCRPETIANIIAPEFTGATCFTYLW
jgi:hypothetical protein